MTVATKAAAVGTAATAAMAVAAEAATEVAADMVAAVDAVATKETMLQRKKPPPARIQLHYRPRHCP